MHFIPLGWPKKKVKVQKAKIIFKEKIYYLGKFFKRNINVIIDLKKKQVEKKWYINKTLEKKTVSIFLTYKFHNFFFKFPISFLKFVFFFKNKKKIKLKKNEIILFGPFSWNYAHQIHEFLIRIAYLKKKKYNTIYLPNHLKKILFSKIYKKIFSDKEFKFFHPDETIEFSNAAYLSHIENRFVNSEFKKTLQFLRDSVQKQKIRKKFQYILVSRQNAKSRVLLNENLLFAKLSKYGFKKIIFEKLSIDKQIELTKNCKIMVGFHGAGISNCAYMKKNSLVIEIANKYYPHPHFELFCRCLNIKYRRFFCVKNYKNLDGTCDISQIINFIKSKIN